jgi:hypothetical protein
VAIGEGSSGQAWNVHGHLFGRDLLKNIIDTQAVKSGRCFHDPSTRYDPVWIAMTFRSCLKWQHNE